MYKNNISVVLVRFQLHATSLQLERKKADTILINCKDNVEVVFYLSDHQQHEKNVDFPIIYIEGKVNTVVLVFSSFVL